MSATTDTHRRLPRGIAAVIAAVSGLKAGKGCLNLGDWTRPPLAAIAAVRAEFGG